MKHLFFKSFLVDVYVSQVLFECQPTHETWVFLYNVSPSENNVDIYCMS